jgi:hypothetical protein
VNIVKQLQGQKDSSKNSSAPGGPANNTSHLMAMA